MFPLIRSKRQPPLAVTTAAGARAQPRSHADLVFPTPSPPYLFSSVSRPPPPPTPDNFPQMAHQKRFIERKYRQELKEMRREREQQERESDEEEDCRK